MAPQAGGKRKRGDRTYSGDSLHDASRPSPHRPGNLSLAQQSEGRDGPESRGRGGRRGGRGARAGSQGRAVTNGPAQVSSPEPRPATPATAAIPAQQEVPGPEDAQSSIRSTLATEAPTGVDPVEPPQFDYTHLTDDICAAWESDGQQVVLSTALKAREGSDENTLSEIFQELVRAAISGRVSAASAGELVKRVIGDGSKDMDAEEEAPGVPSVLEASFLDALSITIEALPDPPTVFLRALVFSTGIPAETFRQELEGPLLQSLELIRTTFTRMGIRKQTNLLYRQANFNLLREESEGFAKLMTELFTTSNNEPPTSENVEDTVERVKAMIGAFDLDVGRTLDVVLDVFGAVLVKQCRFFIKFLRASPWWPRSHASNGDRGKVAHVDNLPQWALPGSSAWHLTDDQRDDVAQLIEDRDKLFWSRARQVGMQAFYELGRERVSMQDHFTEIAAQNDGSTDSEDFMEQWMSQTGTIPPKGNRDAAQLLGFKLRFYSSSEARTENDVLPENIVQLAALLIKVGFISLKDLYPHIWHSDEEMENLRHEKTKEKIDRERAARPGASAKNALLMAGALADDTLPPVSRLRDAETRASTPAKEADADAGKSATKTATSSKTEPLDQKVLLLRSLLAVGAIPDALFILGRFPWLLELYPDLSDYLHRIIHHSLTKVYSTLQPLRTRSSVHYQRPTAESDIPGLPKGSVRLANAPSHKTLRWAHLDRKDAAIDGCDYKFYWDEWSDNVPICHSVDDVFTLSETFMKLSGARLGQDPILLTKLARIGKNSLADDKSELNAERWIGLCKRLLIPALSFTKSNAGVVGEVFEVVSNLPVDVRYEIYLEWSAGQTSRSPELKAAFEQARAETTDILKRISKTNLRPMARSLAKIAFANPHIVITTALKQIENYDSIADAFVEGARYFTDLGYDTLTWALVSAMGREGRKRVQEGGMFRSRWLSALAAFTGKIYKRYNMMRPGPVLQYVADQLQKGNSTDLVVLEQLILSMAGITTDTNYNDAQIQAMGGGELLQAQTVLQLLDKRHESKTTAKRLMKSLRDSGLTGRLLVSLAQRRQACVFDDDSEDAPLKLLGNTFDELHRVMAQYLDLLMSNLTADELQDVIPDVIELLLDYGIYPEIAFWLCRPTIARRMVEDDKAHNQKRSSEDGLARELPNDIEMIDEANGTGEEDGEALESEVTPENAATPSAAEISGTLLNGDNPDADLELVSDANKKDAGQWHPILQSIMDSIGSSLPTEVVDAIGLGFYVTFWQLSLYDITIPGKSYEDEVERQKRRIAAITADRADVSVSGSRRKEAEKRQLSELIDRLLAENRDHLKAYGECKKRLLRERDQWFAGIGRKYEQLNSALMEYCFLPRILCSPIDSFFCFKMVKLLSTNGTPNFRTLGFYDLIFKQDRLTSLIFTSTSKEADNLGRFLNEILRDLGRWHKDKTVFEREAYGSKRSLPGFAMQLDPAGKPTIFLSYEDFRRILAKWHGMVFGAMQNCLSSTEYMHIRNAISVLRSISQHFPVITFHGTSLQKIITSLAMSDMEDVVVSSKAVMGALTRREKSWMLIQAFRKGQEKSTTEEKASTPDAAAQKRSESTLNAAANDFRPAADTVSQSAEKKAAEDGEVDDSQVVATDSKPSQATAIESKAAVEAEQNPAAGQAAPSSHGALPTNVPGASMKLLHRSRPDSSSSLNTTKPAPPSYRDTVNSNRGTPQPASVPRRPEHDRIAYSAQTEPDLPSRPERTERSERSERAERPDSRSSRPADARYPARAPLPTDLVRDPKERPRYRDEPERGQLGSHLRDFDQRGPRHDRTHDSRPLTDRSELPRGHDYGPPSRLRVDERPSGAPPRDQGPPMWEADRSNRSRPALEPQSDRFAESRVPQSGMAPPRPQTNPQAESVGINPERAALIGSGLDSRSGMSIKGQGDERSSRTSRPTSPRRGDDRHSGRRTDRPDNESLLPSRQPPRHAEGGRNRSDGPGLAPSWDRHSSHNDHGRELHHPPSQPPQVDMNHGRLNQDSRYSSQTQEEAPVSSPSTSDIPSGPRSRNSLPGGRAPLPPQAPPINTQQLPQPGPFRPGGPDGQTPTGPSARSHTRNNSYHESSGFGPAPTPATPAADTTGVHPDRLKHIAPPPTDGQGPRPLPFAARPPPPSPIQSSPPRVPSGPRGSAPSGAPSGPSPTTRGPPSGPQFGTDSAMRGGRGNRHPLTAVNNHLQQAGQGTSIRGRGGMRNAGSMPPQGGQPAPMAGSGPDVRSEVAFPPQQNGERPDLFNNRALHPNGTGAAQQQQYGERPPMHRQPVQREDMQRAPSGRRADLMEEGDQSNRGAVRHSNSRQHTPDREGTRRSERDGSHRDYGKDRDRDREYRKEGDGEGPRGSSSRGDEEPPRRSGRGREGGGNDMPGPQVEPSGPSMHEPGPRRGQGAGHGPGSGPRRGFDERGEPRGPPAPAPAGDLPPRKHGRDGDGAPYGPNSGSGRGGMRMASESKRPRRGG